jgi:hypothetical protein
MLLLIGLVTLGTRLAVVPQSTELNMDADAPHFMNVARCFSRGQGFSNPSAWPAWMKPECLPMPETFKEPAYPWAIAKLTPLARGPFQAGQLISFLAGLLTPFLTWMLMRRLHPQILAAHIAGLMAAASPLLIAQSSRVMVESVFAAGLLLSLARWRQWLFAYLQIGLTLGFVFAVNWDARYFASAVPLWCVLTAPGALWLARTLAPAPLVGRVRGAHLLVAFLVALVLLQSVAAWRTVAHQGTGTENAAARAEAPFLRAHLSPDEAVMALTTSFYAYWADRPAVYLPIADTPRFMEVVRRLKVRYAALPTSALAELAARYPGGRLPATLVLDHVNEADDVSVFRVVDAAAGTRATPGPDPGHGPAAVPRGQPR